ncbi:hypothetical protein MJA45_27185 [Paenibacillus aurantius]|uniref:Uncharacterized protein n=1 Tax=Paenibacillus aurantius TaxID=2918900 RepID=A0AA96LCP8_9BACL|nr:hypothetical protein [Paenibacillus aurantius]WNQ11241.1 hypothetical protein MJA45_27185 [Paenibacillus aurantius]
MRTRRAAALTAVVMWAAVLLVIAYGLSSFGGEKTFGDAGLPAAYDLSFGYRLNDTNLRFTDEDTSFSRKTGLKVLVGYPDAPEDGQARLLITKRTGSRMVTVDENWQLEPGVTGHLFELKAEEWAAGEYLCTFTINGVMVASVPLEIT